MLNGLALLGNKTIVGIVLLSLLFSGEAGTSATQIFDHTAGGSADGLVSSVKVKSSVTLALNQTFIRRGEQIWLAGRLKQGTKAASDITVVIERRRSSAASWKRYTSVRTRSNGKFTATILPTGIDEYRARVAATSKVDGAVSSAKRVKFSATKRNLASRTAAIGARLGKPTSEGVALAP